MSAAVGFFAVVIRSSASRPPVVRFGRPNPAKSLRRQQSARFFSSKVVIGRHRSSKVVISPAAVVVSVVIFPAGIGTARRPVVDRHVDRCGPFAPARRQALDMPCRRPVDGQQK